MKIFTLILSIQYGFDKLHTLSRILTVDTHIAVNNSPYTFIILLKFGVLIIKYRKYYVCQNLYINIVYN